MKICPECNYKRSARDNRLFPDYECPACGIIFEKDKARQALAALEKQRQMERRAKQEKIKQEKEQRRREEEARRKREAEEMQAKEEEQRQREIEAEKIRQQEEAERLRILEAERLQKEELERKAADEAARILKLEAAKALREAEEEKQRQEELERNKRKERLEKIEQKIAEHAGRLISSTDTEKTYQLYHMCPFGMLRTGKGLGIVGFGETRDRALHAPCMQKFCRLWTWKTNTAGKVYAEGCALQFLGLSQDEIERDFAIKNREILEETSGQPKEETSEQI